MGEEKKEKKDEETTWSKFYKEFAKNLKMGCYEDDSNRSKISKLLRFTTNKADKEISLDKYLDRMSETQESIYYMAGESMDVMMKSPNLQVFKEGSRGADAHGPLGRVLHPEARGLRGEEVRLHPEGG